MNQTTEEKQKSVTILVNNQAVEVPDREVTGLEIKRLAGVPDDFRRPKQGKHERRESME